MTEVSERGRGLAAGVAAYVIWGFFPLVFPLLKPAAPLEILAHRVVWTFLAVTAGLVLLRTDWRWLRELRTPGRLPRLLLASALIALNWLTFIWAVNSTFVVEASLGYFINPLVNIVFGMLFFGEPISRAGAIGAGLAFAGVAVIAWENWATLWVSLVLALSFASYGGVKKRATLPALPGLFVESALLTPLAVSWLALLAVTDAGTFGSEPRVSLLLVVAGVLTALPLWLFALALPRLSFGVVGVLQYLAPTIMFILGLAVFRQHVSLSYWMGLVLVWLGSAVYLTAAFRRPDASAAAR